MPGKVTRWCRKKLETTSILPANQGGPRVSPRARLRRRRLAASPCIEGIGGTGPRRHLVYLVVSHWRLRNLWETVGQVAPARLARRGWPRRVELSQIAGTQVEEHAGDPGFGPDWCRWAVCAAPPNASSFPPLLPLDVCPPASLGTVADAVLRRKTKSPRTAQTRKGV